MRRCICLSIAPVVEPLFAKSSGHVTGDKGNPYHSSKLDGKKGRCKTGFHGSHGYMSYGQVLGLW